MKIASRSCAARGFVRQAALLTAIVTAAPAFAGLQPDIFWYYDGAIERIGVDGAGRQAVLDGYPDGWGLDVSADLGKLYWADRLAGRILRANLDGSAPQVIATGLGETQDVLIDAAAGHVYWSDSALDKIQRANLDGSGVTDILTGVGFVTCMHLDAVGGKIYFSESETDTVRRVNLDGTNQETLLLSRGPSGGDPRGVDVDLANGHIYFSDLKRDAIFRANLDGSGEVPFVTGLDKVFDLQIAPQTQELFWFENTTGVLYKSPLGTASPSIVATNAAAWGMGITPEPATLTLLVWACALLPRGPRPPDH